MAKVSPYHTNSTEYTPEHRNVHHDHDNCPDGKRIKPEHRVSETGHKPRCEECIKLGYRTMWNLHPRDDMEATDMRRGVQLVRAADVSR